ncbi:hypothetical protein SAY87_000916 [Trapa incisa]|uniref:Uncharacterized protein n=1 Tax=Trapa incisa TaxID=236973 RepID=A0AAN7JHA5_9MYRT|nr:hypothetical protein SAY87_000916 [Trapa incisa]
MTFSLVFIGPPWATMGGDYRNKPEDFTVVPKWVPFESSIAYSYFSIKKIFDAVQVNELGVSDFYRFGAGQEGADILVSRSSYEVELEWLKLLEELTQKPVFPLGQLSRRSSDLNPGKETEAWLCIKQWLDSQNKGLVIYVAFGSECKPSQYELTRIALGLENSGMPFFWVLRTQMGSSDNEPIELPEGFEERVKGRGLVWRTWAPQFEILAHDSVGGFLTHSGWGSVVDSLSFGRALILLSFLSDQELNSRFLVEKKMGYPIPRNELDGSFTSDSVTESLRLVMVEEQGRCYRENAKKMEELLGDQELQESYVDNFLNYMKSTRWRKEILQH